MIQFNLLPVVKLDYVRTRRNKRTAILAAGFVTGISLMIVALMTFSFMVVKKHSADLSTDINTETKKLQSVKDINKILTIQGQLGSLTALHEAKPAASRVSDYMKQLTPVTVSIATLNVDFDAHTMSITGSADALSSVNTFTDTLKFTTYKADDNKTGNAFSDTVLTSFGRNEKGASYTITLSFDPIIFANTGNVSIVVPSGKITTRSETEKPTDLFQKPLDTNKAGQ